MFSVIFSGLVDVFKSFVPQCKMKLLYQKQGLETSSKLFCAYTELISTTIIGK